GRDNEKLEWDFWDVSDLKGQTAAIEIVDQESGGWGHINIDDIQFADEPPKEARVRPLKEQPDFGTLAPAVLAEKATARGPDFEPFRTAGELEQEPKPVTFPLGQDRTGGLATRFTLPPNETREVVFLVTWHFAHAEHGRMYDNWFKDAVAVAKYLRDNLDPLS